MGGVPRRSGCGGDGWRGVAGEFREVGGGGRGGALVSGGVFFFGFFWLWDGSRGGGEERGVDGEEGEGGGRGRERRGRWERRML